MGRNRPFLLLFLVALLAWFLSGPAAGEGPREGPAPSGTPRAGPPPVVSSVDLRNEASLTISVPRGTDDGVTAESDFAVLGADNQVLLHIFPFELYTNRFWSQPLSSSEFSRITTGMAVRKAGLSDALHLRIRVEGEVRRQEYLERQRAARQEAARAEIKGLREKRGRLEGRREDLDERIAAAEKDLIDEESRMEWLVGSEDRDIDRSIDEILALAEERDELQLRRLSLSKETPIPREEINRLTAEIRRLNDRLETERGRIRSARDRKRSARYAYQSRRKEWQELVADRRRVAAEIEAVDRKIRDFSEVLQ